MSELMSDEEIEEGLKGGWGLNRIDAHRALETAKAAKAEVVRLTERLDRKTEKYEAAFKANVELVKDRDALRKRVEEALDFAGQYAQIDGSHHKMWVIDQMVRALTGNEYAQWVESTLPEGATAEDYPWDEGIAP